MVKKYLVLLILLVYLLICIFGQTQSEYEEKRNKFASEGFGFNYNLEEYNSRTIFLENHGLPIKTDEESIINRYNGLEDKIITLEYKYFNVKFYEWNENIEGNYPESMMLSIESRENIEYLYGIKHGMTKEELYEIFGVIELNNDRTIWINGNSNIARIYLRNNEIEYIIWNYSLE